MSRHPVEQVDARWRIDVGEECLSLFDVDLDGRTTTVTAEAARRLRDQLTGALDAAGRFANEEATQAAETP
jgi:hypothetical protein